MRADLHGHLHPCFDYREALGQAWAGMSRGLDPDREGRPRVLVLAERGDETLFDEIAGGGHRERIHPWRMAAMPERDGLRLDDGEGRSLWLVRGRQIVSAEKLEIVALCSGAAGLDGLPAADILPAIRSVQGIPMISWAPGKWMFRRGELLRALIDENAGSTLLLGDTPMRPRGFLDPPAFRRALDAGLAIVAGSDPLPVPGEEALLGTYVTDLAGCEASSCPCKVLKRELVAGRGRFSVAGERNGLLDAWRRWRSHRSS